MAFGINREQLERWKEQVVKGEIAVITHYWEDERFPGCTSVTKVGCSNLEKLKEWGETYKLKSTWIHQSNYPHFDVFGSKQEEVLKRENMTEQLNQFIYKKPRCT
ncbi:MAG TPA: hypothetical protein VK078_08225 [Pseudogracilibacillus sp.]|nr:hypothetical protein [Pseudogracilibacillus sp.]